MTGGASSGGRRFRDTTPNWRRLLTLAVLAFVLGAACVAEAAVERPAPLAARIEPTGAPTEQAASSAWFCPYVPAVRANPGAGSVLVVNIGDRPLTGTMSIVPAGIGVAATSVDVPVAVGPGERSTFQPGVVVDAAVAAVTVRLAGGGALVEHFVRDSSGESWATCALAGGNEWHVGDASTAAGTVQLALFNPFADDAIADLRFATSDGRAEPGTFQGVVVPAGRLVVLDVTNTLRRRDWLAGSIDVRSGRLVVDQFEAGQINGASGIALQPATVAAPQWSFPDGLVADGVGDRITMYNPADREAEVRVEVLADEGIVAPMQAFVPAGGRVTLDLAAEPRMPRGVRYGLDLTSTNGVDIVVERSATSRPPSPFSGTTSQVGSPMTALRWGLAAGAPQGPASEWVWVLNAGFKVASVRVTVVGGGRKSELPAAARVEPGRRLMLRVSDVAPTADASVIVDSDMPVVVGRDLWRTDRPGWSSTLGVPLR